MGTKGFSIYLTPVLRCLQHMTLDRASASLGANYRLVRNRLQREITFEIHIIPTVPVNPDL